MIFSIPIFIEERSSGLAKPPTYIVRPLVQVEPVQRAEKLSRALAKLSNDLHQLLHDLGHDPRHDELARWTFNPLLEETTLELRLELSSGSHRRAFFLVGYAALDRKLYFTPTLPELHFEVLPNQSLAERATAVLTRHFREQERDSGPVDLDDYALSGKARLTMLELVLNPAALAKKPKKPTRAVLFGGEEKKDGEVELRKTGRRLNAMYPDDLDRALGREREVEELARLLAAADRRPVLLVGSRLVGKTTILHELVWQMCTRKKERFGGGRDVWLLSPMRLISGMSYLGEWENRVLAILEHAKDKDRVLYFDDLLGLFTAGISSASDLNVAQVLRPWLEKRAVRLIAEITPEAWRVLRERDRAFADLFHVIPVNEPPESETLRVLINVGRQLEETHRCGFDLEIVPTAYELHRRFATDAVFPGKAAGFLKRLAIRFAGGHVTRWHALHEFHQQSGLQIAMLDDSAKLERKTILEQLRNRVVGQDHALDAFADVLVTLKARLNDPRRPLGTMLLLGPTGVGKTQAAKALAELLFGGGDRLLRFDMNEYVDGASASRLTGSPRDPEGLLTSAVRRQPFSVVLFDEIEKAAPEVFDLLLAVLDEGRLTDALGRVTDFTQTVILLTSNLGAREARARLGFGSFAAGAEADDAAYVSAAEKFFRPEFFNRLDRIIPFRSLERTHLEGIARQLISGLLARDGLRRRDGLLNVSPDAMKRLVELGHHPQLGARALKRVVEREVAQPLAELLVALPPGTPMIANLVTREDGFAVSLKDLSPVPRSVFWPEAIAQTRTAAANRAWTTQVLDGVYAALDRIEAELEKDAPVGKIELGALPPEHVRYFFCREHLKKVDRLVQAVERAQDAPRHAPNAPRLPRAKPVKIVVRQYMSSNPRFGRLRDAVALQHDLADLETEPVEVPDSPFTALLREIALLEALATNPVDTEAALLVFRACLPEDATAMFRLAESYGECLGYVWGASAAVLFESFIPEELLLKRIFGEPHGESLGRTQAIYLRGINVRRLVPSQTNTILTRRADGGTGIVLLTLEAATTEAAARVRAKQLAEAIDVLESESFGPVIQRVVENKTLTDFRSGVVVPARPSGEEFRALLLSAVPLPPEVAQQINP
jgi:ATP-dependent Clp protease ATP-binding subunit ClpC